MKLKYIYIFLFVFVFSLTSNATTLEGNINFTWDTLSQTERDNDIFTIKNKLFNLETIYKYDKKVFKSTYKNFKKDKNYKNNFMYLQAGITDFDDKIIVPFYFKKLLIGYGLIYKNDLKHCYYYNALGKLFIVEIFENNYNKYPVISYQYDIRGKLVSAVYSLDKYDDYMYKNDTFLGRCYKENCYDKKGKIITTRNLGY